jgi:hypothetical protein
VVFPLKELFSTELIVTEFGATNLFRGRGRTSGQEYDNAN